MADVALQRGPAFVRRFVRGDEVLQMSKTVRHALELSCVPNVFLDVLDKLLTHFVTQLCRICRTSSTSSVSLF